jgi:type IV pilus assembly protein PilC
LADARETVRGGAALSVALAQFPRHFPPLFTAALQAGEQSGNFTDALARYVEYQRRLLALRQRMRAALTYPVILTVASFAVIVFLLAFVVPTFTRIYEDMEGQLPVATRMLVHATGSLRAALPLALGLVALAAAGIWRWRRTPTGEEITDRILLRFPWVGSVLAGYQYSRFARTLAMMQAGGIPMIPSLEATLSVVRNRHLASRIRTALPRVTAGGSLADSLGRTGAVPPLMLELIAVGENSGALTEMLGHTADLLDAELDTRLTTLAAAIEPVIMIGMGLVVATIVVIMYLPIFHLASVVR